MGVKYVVKEYEVLEGDIINPFHKEKPKTHYTCYTPGRSGAIILPDRSSLPDGKVLPIPLERYRMIQECKKAGIDVGVKVIRVVHITDYNVRNPVMHGVVKNFTMKIESSYYKYMPIMVEFTSSIGIKNTMPFSLEEIETIENAKLQLEKENKTGERQETIAEAIIKDLERQRHGVVPFRRDVM